VINLSKQNVEFIVEDLSALAPDRLLEAMLDDLAFEYVNKFGYKPSKLMLNDWFERMNNAYYGGLITRAEENNGQ